MLPPKSPFWFDLVGALCLLWGFRKLRWFRLGITGGRPGGVVVPKKGGLGVRLVFFRGFREMCVMSDRGTKIRSIGGSIVCCRNHCVEKGLTREDL